MKLIDSSIWIPAMRPRGNANFLAVTRDLIERELAAINGTILLELLVRARDPEQFAALREHLGGIRNLATTQLTWDIAAELGFRLYRAGFPTAVPDLTIAASAIEHGVVLVHADSDFDRIAQHSDLKVESYV
jgi:predicted nucleic acid-binding protein